MPLSQEGQGRSQRQNLLLALTLAGVAGAVNAIGIISLGSTTSHLTGTATHIGMSLAESQWDLVLRTGSLLFFFLVGVMTATLFVERAKIIQGQARYAAALLIEVFMLTGFTVTCELVTPRPAWLEMPLVWTLCVAMGLQNALVTKISRAIVRTTHVTGIVTDLGIELVRLGVWFRQRMLHPKAWAALASDPELYKVRLHGTILLSFISGSAMGTSLVIHTGPLAMIGPVVVVTALVLYDRVLWLHFFDEATPPPESSDEKQRAA